MAEHGWETARCACRLSGQEELLDELETSGQCVSLEQLAVGGRNLDFLEGPAVGKMLRRLLEWVLEHPEDNVRPRLLKLAEQWKENQP